MLQQALQCTASHRRAPDCTPALVSKLPLPLASLPHWTAHLPRLHPAEVYTSHLGAHMTACAACSFSCDGKCRLGLLLCMTKPAYSLCMYLLLGENSQGGFQIALVPHALCKVVVYVFQVLPGLLSSRSHSVQVLQDSSRVFQGTVVLGESQVRTQPHLKGQRTNVLRRRRSLMRSKADSQPGLRHVEALMASTVGSSTS